MMLVRSYVAQSAIQGLGVFAGEFIPKGMMLWEINPKFDVFISESEAANLPAHIQEYLARYTYPHLEKPGFIILDSDDGKYMNHSETPNTDFREFARGYAVHDIQKGDEITCNYYEFDPEFSGFSDNLIVSNKARLSPKDR
ncbi:MAG: SET domain-containing protein-lysine N-methyltransferase [Pseudomonadota bacterium]|nr:SET domain-containing protein-lysine N-methyltransferase [Pseudomonadota bacterium]